MESIFGFIGAACTTIAFLPQTLKIIKTKSTKDVSLIMYIIYVIGISCWLTYGIMINDYPIIGANVISFMFAVTILGLKLKYK